MPQKKQSKEPKEVNNYLKYSQLGLQLFITIGIAGYLGYKLDEWLRDGRPLFLIILIFAAALGGFIQLYRSLPKD